MKRLAPIAVVVALLGAACSGSDAGDRITVYSGRSEVLVQPLIDRFVAETGIQVDVRYAGSAELAATILEEGTSSPADVFFAQDPASLGAIAPLLSPLPASIIDKVPARFSDDAGLWVGISGRARTVVYDTTTVDVATLPDSEDGFTGPGWRGRLAVSPTNGSFLAFVAAKILLDGENATRQWLNGIAANDEPTFPNNATIVAAVDAGEVDAGLTNHYYLYRLLDEKGSVTAANHFLTSGAGALVMPAGAGILATSDARAASERFIEFLLNSESQEYFANETFEYPLAAGVAADSSLPPLDSLPGVAINLSDLAGALDLATDLVASAGLL